MRKKIEVNRRSCEDTQKSQKARSQWETNTLPDKSAMTFGVARGLTKQIYHHNAILLAGEVP